jgi:uncharacterized protein (TIGR02145 family)
LKATIYLCLFVLLGFSLVLIYNCKKEDSNIITDIDGNTYHKITLGSQVWMLENLNVTHYNNGDSIPNVTDSATWVNLESGAYCNYHNFPENAITYGRLYNWYAVNDSRDLCPTGWHVATEDDWNLLTDYLGGEDAAGGKLKEHGSYHWQI